MKRLLFIAILLGSSAVAFGQEEAAWQGKTAGQWAGALEDADERVQWYAAYALGQLGPDASEAAEPLIAVLAQRSRNEYVRGNAAWALGRIGVADRAVLEVLTDTMATKVHTSVRRTCPVALGNLGPAAGPAVPALLELLEDKDATVRVNAAVALWKINRHERAIAALAEMIRSGPTPAAYRATGALGRLGAEPDTVAPPLVEAFHHADRDVRRSASRALGQLGPAAIGALKRPLADPDPEVRRSAVEALGWIGPKAVPDLIAALKNEAPEARRAAARALGRLGGAAKAAEAALIETVNDRNRDVRQAAAKALKEIRDVEVHGNPTHGEVLGENETNERRIHLSALRKDNECSGRICGPERAGQSSAC